MNNYFKQCPPMMSDGRLFTDWRTAVRRNEYVKFINNIVRDDEYRLFLEYNADRIMDNDWNYTRKHKSCWTNECVHTYPTRVYPPMFTEEIRKYNTLQEPNKKTVYVCSPEKDYRASYTIDNLEHYFNKSNGKK